MLHPCMKSPRVRWSLLATRPFQRNSTVYRLAYRSERRQLASQAAPRKSSVFLITSAIGLFANTAYLAYSSEYRYHAGLFVTGMLRSINTAFTAGVIVLDYKILYLRWATRGHDSPDYNDELLVVSKRSANRLLRLCNQNKGLYIKACQWFSIVASGRNDIFQTYVDVLNVMQDRAPQRSYKQVERTFKSEFGGLGPSDIFEDFDQTPIAAASLAQVHKAIYNGETVAVKVQHDDVTRLFAIDIATMRVMSGVVWWLFDGVDLSWLVNTFENTIIREFDFENEAQNAKDTAQRFSFLKESFHVPKTFPEVTTPRVLTMEFVNGVKITDLDGLRKLGIDPKIVYAKVIEIFSRMILIHGEVHADPHPGNIFVTKSKSGKPCICLIDHGLYRVLDDDFRLNYCLLWKSILLNDNKTLQIAAKNLNVPPRFIELLPVLLTGRSITPSKPLGVNMSKEERDQVRQQVGDVQMKDVVEFLRALPPDMLLVQRTNRLLHGIRKTLGGSPTLIFSINARYAVMGCWSETRLEERERLRTTNARTLARPTKWYLFGNTPNLKRSIRYVHEAILTQLRMVIFETLLNAYILYRRWMYGEKIEWSK